MADENSSVISKPISLTIVDVLGALVPGLVWLILLIMFIYTILSDDKTSFPSQEKIADAIRGFSGLSAVIQSTTVTVILSVSLVIGYIAKAFAMGIAGFLESIFLTLVIIMKLFLKRITLSDDIANLRFHRKIIGINRQCEFPYHIFHQEQAYFSELMKVAEGVSRQVGIMPPSRSPFSYCKRFVKVIAPELWEELVHFEAEVRMMGALSVACLTASFLFAYMACRFHNLFFIKISGITLFFTLLFGLAFSWRRQAEVKYTYLNALLALRRKKA